MIKYFSVPYSLFLIFSDLFIVVAALQAATQLRIHIPLGMQMPSDNIWKLPFPVYLMAVLIWLIIFNVFEVYTIRPVQTLFREVQHIVLISIVAWLIFVGTLYLTYRDISRLQTVYFLAAYLMMVWLHRLTLRLLYMRFRWLEHRKQNILLVGTGKGAEALIQLIKDYSWVGYHLVGGVANKPTKIEIPILGTLEDIPALVEQHRITEIVIADLESQQEMMRLVQQLQLLPVNIRIAPDYFDMAFLNLKAEDFGNIPLITLKDAAFTPFQTITKRIFDLVLTLVLLIPVLPLMAIIAVMIRLDSPGSPIFKQERIKKGGQPFMMYKFRTMYQHLADVNRVAVDEEGHIIHKRPDDPRVTRVGWFLRHTSLDELPQFINVLKGDMSLVGPRPEMPWLVEKYEVWQRKRFAVPQGMTGWWQVNGRAERLMHLNIDQDLYYIRNYSIWLDMKILWMTIGAVISGRGAY